MLWTIHEAQLTACRYRVRSESQRITTRQALGITDSELPANRKGSVSRETVEQTRSASLLQIFLAATTRCVHRMPRCIATTVAIMVTDLRTTFATARPVITDRVSLVGEVCCSVFLRAG
jgi:hypothetical protein